MTNRKTKKAQQLKLTT